MPAPDQHHRSKILFIDDEPSKMSACIELLGVRHDVKVLDEPLELERALEWHPDVAVVDVKMPKRNGLDCADIISETDPECIIILVTAFAQFADRAITEGLKSGIYFFLKQPFSPAVLDAIVDRGLETRRLRLQAKSDISRAVRVQRLLRPQPLTTTDHMKISTAQRGAADLCGDAVDVVVLDNSVYCMIADVMGHGTSAALFTTMLHMVFRSTLLKGGDLSEAARGLAQVAPMLPDGMFVTCCMLDLDVNFSNLKYISFGHTPGYLLGEGSASPLPTQLELLHNGFAARLTIHEQPLDDVDAILLVTDGLTESRDRLGESLLPEGVVSLCQSVLGERQRENTAEALVERVFVRSGNGIDDDCTAVLIERTSP
ncbi:MAG: SpoIIE family protein phosphatase [Planctomycetota bacterium]